MRIFMWTSTANFCDANGFRLAAEQSQGGMPLHGSCSSCWWHAVAAWLQLVLLILCLLWVATSCWLRAPSPASASPGFNPPTSTPIPLPLSPEVTPVNRRHQELPVPAAPVRPLREHQAGGLAPQYHTHIYCADVARRVDRQFEDSLPRWRPRRRRRLRNLSPEAYRRISPPRFDNVSSSNVSSSQFREPPLPRHHNSPVTEESNQEQPEGHEGGQARGLQPNGNVREQGHERSACDNGGLVHHHQHQQQQQQQHHDRVGEDNSTDSIVSGRRPRRMPTASTPPGPAFDAFDRTMTVYIPLATEEFFC